MIEDRKRLTLAISVAASLMTAFAAMAAEEPAPAAPAPAANAAPAASTAPSPTAAPAANAAPAAAETGQSPETAAAVAKIGKKIDREATMAIYTPLQPADRYDGVTIKRDETYGPDPKNKLDVFTPTAGAKGEPVLVFLHGGGWTSGDKVLPNSPFNDNIGLWAAKNGLIGVTADYRLAPDAHYPADVEDVGMMVQWLKAHAADYGGDPARIFLWGHSSGAAEVADYIAERARQRKDAGIAGAVLSSGIYDLDPKDARWKAFYGEDVDRYDHIESLPQIATTSIPILFNDAEFDPDYFQKQTQTVLAVRKDADIPVAYVHLKGHSHLSQVYAIGSTDQSLAGPILNFIKKTSGLTQQASN